MPTAKDVKKQLKFAGDNKPNNSRIRPLRNCTLGSVVSNTAINLLKCSSASFDNLIGEGAPTSIISTNKTMKLNKKQEETLKMKMLLTLNDNVLHADGVSVSEATETSFENESDNPIVNSEENMQQVQSTASIGSVDRLNREILLDKQNDMVKQVQPIPNNNLHSCLTTGLVKDDHQSDKENAPIKKVKMSENPVSVEQQTVVKGTISQAAKDQADEVVSRNTVVDNSDNNIAQQHHPKIDDSSILDATTPIFLETEVQTDPCYMLCTCIKCKDIVKKFSTYINRGFSDDCIIDNNDRTLDHGKNDESRLSLSCASQNPEENEWMPLFKGSKIKISVTAKGKLKGLDRNPESSPKDYVYAIMDDLYEPLAMANMTAAGRGKGKGSGMEKWVREGIIVYLQNKFEGIDNINAWVNSKCYCERRKKWGEGDAAVRPRLKKNIKSQQTDDNNSAEGSKKKILKKKKRDEEKKGKEKGRSKIEKLTKAKKRKQATEDTENSKKKRIDNPEEHKVSKKIGKGSNTQMQSKFGSLAGTSQKVKCLIDVPKFKKTGSRKQVDDNSPPKKTTFKRRQSSSERPTTGGKRPKPLGDLLLLNQMNSERDDDNDQLEYKRKDKERHDKHSKARETVPETEFINDLKITNTSTPHGKKSGRTSLKGSDFKDNIQESDINSQVDVMEGSNECSEEEDEGEEEEEEEESDDDDDEDDSDDAVSDLTE